MGRGRLSDLRAGASANPQYSLSGPQWRAVCPKYTSFHHPQRSIFWQPWRGSGDCSKSGAGQKSTSFILRRSAGAESFASARDADSRNFLSARSLSVKRGDLGGFSHCPAMVCNRIRDSFCQLPPDIFFDSSDVFNSVSREHGTRPAFLSLDYVTRRAAAATH